MKWGVRRTPQQLGYKSTSIKSYRARRANAKVDAGFKDWKENANKKQNAVDLGKQRNAARIAYEKNRSDKSLKGDYKTANKSYKKALRSNTTYRKGAIRGEVGQDMSRKYLSEAKKVGKQLQKDPGNRQLQKQYSRLMNQHDIERANARKAPMVGAKRSQRKAAMKRTMTMTVKATAATAATAAGALAVSKYLNSHNVTFNGKPVNFGAQNLRDIAGAIKKAKEFMGYFY